MSSRVWYSCFSELRDERVVMPFARTLRSVLLRWCFALGCPSGVLRHRAITSKLCVPKRVSRVQSSEHEGSVVFRSWRMLLALFLWLGGSFWVRFGVLETVFG